jgi:hypothetical protein
MTSQEFSSRYLHGSLESTLLCHLDTILRNVVPMIALLLLDAIIIVRYIFIFHLKNPTALQDDFWKLFINLWTAGACVLSQSVYMMLPGKNPVNFYQCMATYPPDEAKDQGSILQNSISAENFSDKSLSSSFIFLIHLKTAYMNLLSVF